MSLKEKEKQKVKKELELLENAFEYGWMTYDRWARLNDRDMPQDDGNAALCDLKPQYFFKFGKNSIADFFPEHSNGLSLDHEIYYLTVPMAGFEKYDMTAHEAKKKGRELLEEKLRETRKHYRGMFGGDNRTEHNFYKAHNDEELQEILDGITGDIEMIERDSDTGIWRIVETKKYK